MCGHHLLHGIHLHPSDHHDLEAVALTPSSTRTTPCPQCHSPLQEDFVFCPYCGAEVLAACPACHRAVRADWTHCAYCGAELLGEKADIPTHSHH
ncbi:MAG TPA: zinc ribbon domain-containing protein [Anaerolineales bacterium]|nr:zinc ribbon domain-containing protein [Anaerolineales bacterium]